jgi:hypothetical protein
VAQTVAQSVVHLIVQSVAPSVVHQ